MKLKEARKKFTFLKVLLLPDKIFVDCANHLVKLIRGNDQAAFTFLGSRVDPIRLLVEWDIIYEEHESRLNGPLRELERANRAKFSPRSIAAPFSERVNSLRESYKNQDEKHNARFKYLPGDQSLDALTLHDAATYMKGSSSAGLPFLSKKSDNLSFLLSNFYELLDRLDPCMLYTRTAEGGKTRNVWGYPFADTLFEAMFYFPLLVQQKRLFCRASLVSPDLVAHNITKLIDEAIRTDRILYSVDFKSFDSSVKYQYIIEAFEFVKSCYAPVYYPFIDIICERFYTIGIVTPIAIFKGKHGVPSGSTFTNEIDSIIQLGIAMNCNFIKLNECMVQGDDGLYMMNKEDISEFESVFLYAGLKLEKSKSVIAQDYVVFCQNLYHNDYRDENGVIGGIYSTYRALNRLVHTEKYMNFKAMGIPSKDYYAIRGLSILENCKYHPLFEELVRFALVREHIHLDISDDSILNYCVYLNISRPQDGVLNHQYGSQVTGIREFVAYKMASYILTGEGLPDIVRTEDEDRELSEDIDDIDLPF